MEKEVNHKRSILDKATVYDKSRDNRPIRIKTTNAEKSTDPFKRLVSVLKCFGQGAQQLQ